MPHMAITRLGTINVTGHLKAGTRQVQPRKPSWAYLHVCVNDDSRQSKTASMLM